MSTNKDQNPPVEAWLKTFKIEVSSSSNKVYANARQQVEISLTVEAAANQMVTPEQLRSLTPVIQRSDGLYEPLPINLPETSSWFGRSLRDERFEFFNPAFADRLDDDAADAAPMIKQFYVSTFAAGGSSIRLRARILKDPQTEYVTENPFDSVITLESVSPPSYSYPADYAWTLSYNTGDYPGGRFIQEWSLSAVRARFSFAEVQNSQPYGMIRWQRNAPGETFASNVGVALPGDRSVCYNPHISLGEEFPSRLHRQITSPNPNQVVVVLQGDNQIPYYSEGLDHQGPCRLIAVDIHGNSHAIGISFDNSQTDPLVRRITLIVTTISPVLPSDTPAKTPTTSGRDSQ